MADYPHLPTPPAEPTPTGRAYPLPDPGVDFRFSAGLVYDVAEVLGKHGYPTVTGGDWVDLRQCLFRFLYGEAT